MRGSQWTEVKKSGSVGGQTRCRPTGGDRAVGAGSGRGVGGGQAVYGTDPAAAGRSNDHPAARLAGPVARAISSTAQVGAPRSSAWWVKCRLRTGAADTQSVTTAAATERLEGAWRFALCAIRTAATPPIPEDAPAGALGGGAADASGGWERPDATEPTAQPTAATPPIRRARRVHGNLRPFTSMAGRYHISAKAKTAAGHRDSGCQSPSRYLRYQLSFS
jgi:hypothetical protein